MGARRLIVPKRWPLAPAHEEILQRPADFGLTLRPFAVKTAEGLTLRALVAEPSAQAGQSDRGKRLLAVLETHPAPSRSWQPGQPPRGTVVLLHGLNGRKEFLLPVAERLAAVGLRSILYDSRAHGTSDGAYATFGAREVDDAARVLDAAREKCGALGNVSVFGYSMGAAVALQWLPTMEQPASAVLIAPFADLETVVRLRAREQFGGWLAPALPVVRACVRCRAGFDPADISPQKSASHWDGAVPVLIVHGGNDRVIPLSQALQLNATLSAHHRTRTLVIPAAHHGDVMVRGGDALFAAVVTTFLQEK